MQDGLITRLSSAYIFLRAHAYSSCINNIFIQAKMTAVDKSHRIANITRHQRRFITTLSKSCK